MSTVALPIRAITKDIQRNTAPIVAAVDHSAASRAAIGEAVRLGRELEAPVVFVYVRRGPAGFFGAPVYQRRLTKAMARARQVLDRALGVAASAGVHAEAEILEGLPRRRIAEIARDRNARLVVVGSRKRRLGRASRARSFAPPEGRWSSRKGAGGSRSRVRPAECSSAS